MKNINLAKEYLEEVLKIDDEESDDED